jgi:hypothetical protein
MIGGERGKGLTLYQHVKVWIQKMAESSNAKEEDREFGCKKAERGSMNLPARFSPLYPLLRLLGRHRARCLVSSCPTQPTSPMTRGPGSTRPSAWVKLLVTQRNKVKCSCGGCAQCEAVTLFLEPWL